MSFHGYNAPTVKFRVKAQSVTHIQHAVDTADASLLCYKIKIIGPNIDPYRTPVFTGFGLDDKTVQSPRCKSTCCFLSLR